MITKSEWQEANRRITAEQRERLGDPPAAEELLAYSEGRLSAEEEERIRELLVAYPELARMYAAPFPEEPQAGVSKEAIDAGLDDVKRRLGVVSMRPPIRMRRYIPTTIAAALALVFFGLYVQAESRARDARDHTRACDMPRLLGDAQELDPDGNRGPAAPTLLSKDGEAYLVRPRLINQPRFPGYSIVLFDQNKNAIWTSPSAQPNEDDVFQITIPHAFLRPGRYQLRIFGVDGEERKDAGVYDVAVPAE
jgi:hypothetical protein